MPEIVLLQDFEAVAFGTDRAFYLLATDNANPRRLALVPQFTRLLGVRALLLDLVDDSEQFGLAAFLGLLPGLVGCVRCGFPALLCSF